jgi:hypothetical protein
MAGSLIHFQMNTLKIPNTMKKIFTLTVLAFLSLTMVGQSVFLVEHFNYPAADSLQNNGWYGHSAASTNPIQVTNGGLSWSQTNYLGSGVGNAAGVDNTGADENRPFTSFPNIGDVYVSFLMRVRGVVDAANSGYFFHIGQYDNTANPVFTTISTAFRARTYITTGASASKFKLGLTFNSSTIPTTDVSADLDTGATYLVVLKYEFVAGTLNDSVSMYVFADGDNIATEPATATVGPVAGTASDLDFVQLVAMRQFSGTQNVEVDGIIAQDTWNLSATPFDLLSPASGTTITVSGTSAQTAVVTWNATTAAGQTVTYEWLANLPGAGFANPLAALPSDNSGLDTTLTLPYPAIDNLLAGLGIAKGDSVTLDWTVRASAGGAGLLANQVWQITIIRLDDIGIEENSLSQNIKLYPNPARDEAVLEFGVVPGGDVTINVVNKLGQVVSTVNTTAYPGQKISLNVAQLPAGVYQAVIILGGQQTAKPLIVR